MAENQFFIDSDKLSEAALERKHKLETDPSSRTNHMEYMPGMEQIDPTIRNKVLSEMDSYDYNKYTARDVQNALEHETCSVEDFKALLSPAAEPFLERMAQRAKIETGKHFGNTVYLFTPLYIANYCENYCVYCGFNCYNDIHRKKLTFEEIEHEMKVIADSGIEEILMLTGESKLSEAALERKHKLETDPSSRTNHMEYMPGMEQIDPTIRNKVLSEMDSYDYNKYTARDVQNALEHETCSVEDFKALLSPAAEPFLERMAQRAKIETGKHFGNTVYLFTPLYIANYCENYCVYCGFNCYNDIHRKKLTFEEIEHEMKVIADSGIEEILMLTGESRAQSDVEYIGEACRLAKKYFRNIGLEIYPVNSDEYRYLHECGADYVTVFQETYDNVKYETLHLMGHKRVFPYRFEAQERALMGGMRGVGFSALLGLSDFHKDALASALHIYYLQRKYPYAEYSLSCPRLRPIINNDKINPLDVHEKQLCQILCAYRIFLPYVGITVSSREQKHFRDGIVKIAATKVSAGVSTGIGDHESKYTGKDTGESGDEQFEISDGRSFDQMYNDMESEGLQPVLNDYVYV